MSYSITTVFEVEGLDSTEQAFDRIAAKSADTSNKIETSNQKVDVSYRKLAINIANVGTAGLALESTWQRVAAGQMNVLEGIIRTIPTLITLASSIWAIVGAEKARTIAHAIAHSVASLGTAVPIIAAATAAGFAAVTAATALIPTKHFGGYIPETGIYGLKAGERVVNEAVEPPRKEAVSKPTTIEPHFHFHNTVFRNRRDMNFFLSKLKRLNLA